MINIKNMKRSETTEQIELFRWADQWAPYVPELNLMYHIPNEGKRTNGAVLKAMGMRQGVPDICLPVPKGVCHGLYIEMKYASGKTTKEQDMFLQGLRDKGYAVKVAYSAEEAKKKIREYLFTYHGFCLITCEDKIGLDGTCRGMFYKKTYTGHNEELLNPRCENCKYLRVKEETR